MLLIQKTIILEFPNLIPPVWWMLAPAVLTVKVTAADCGYSQRHPIFVHSNAFLALYPASPRRPKPNPTFLSPPFQVAATCTSLNIRPWEGFFVLSASYGVTWYFHMCTKPHICRKLRKLLHILLPPPQVLNIDLGKTLHMYIDHEHIISLDTLSFYLEQDKELQNIMWQEDRNYSSHSFNTVLWWIAAVTFLFYFGWFTNCHMSDSFKRQFGAWLIDLQDATWFEELELHYLEFCVSQKTAHSVLGRQGQCLTLLRCLGQESSLTFISTFIFLYLCPAWTLQLHLSVFSPSQNWELTQQAVFVESQSVNCLGSSLSQEIVKTFSCLASGRDWASVQATSGVIGLRNSET